MVTLTDYIPCLSLTIVLGIVWEAICINWLGIFEGSTHDSWRKGHTTHY